VTLHEHHLPDQLIPVRALNERPKILPLRLLIFEGVRPRKLGRIHQSHSPKGSNAQTGVPPRWPKRTLKGIALGMRGQRWKEDTAISQYAQELRNIHKFPKFGILLRMRNFEPNPL
jgi:hypothetical protein